MVTIARTESTRSSKRLTKPERRRQLLDVARQVLEDTGADALTLGSLAQRAGVSKPVTYEHFGTRSGLLIAMLQDTSTYYQLDAEAKLADAPPVISAVSEIVATAYVHCAIEAGPAMTVLAAAVQADSQAEAVGRTFRSDHAASFQRAFEGLIDDQKTDLALLFKGLVAAANAICDERTQNQITTPQAIATLTHLLETSLSPFAKKLMKSRRRS
ncbi:MAG: TetR/AcrR family transcriptional regulator [Pseudomonadota bacterium]